MARYACLTCGALAQADEARCRLCSGFLAKVRSSATVVGYSPRRASRLESACGVLLFVALHILLHWLQMPAWVRLLELCLTGAPLVMLLVDSGAEHLLAWSWLNLLLYVLFAIPCSIAALSAGLSAGRFGAGLFLSVVLATAATVALCRVTRRR